MRLKKILATALVLGAVALSGGCLPNGSVIDKRSTDLKQPCPKEGDCTIYTLCGENPENSKNGCETVPKAVYEACQKGERYPDCTKAKKD